MRVNRYKDADIDFLRDIEGRHFWYIIRVNVIRDIFNRHFEPKVPEKRILDLGAGNGSAGRVLSKYGRYLAYEDSVRGSRNCASGGYQVVRGDAHHLSLKDNCLDVVCMLDCLEHLEGDRRAINEIGRTLRNSGRLVLFVPSYKFLWSSFDEHSFHHRRYKKKEVHKLLRQEQMRVVEEYHCFSFLFPVVLVVSVLEKIFGTNTSRESWAKKLRPPRNWINSLLVGVGNIEIRLNRIVRIPFGTTYVVIAENER